MGKQSEDTAAPVADSFETQYDKLEKLVREMQNPAVSLTQSFENYKEGMELVQSLNGMIDGIEKQVRELGESAAADEDAE